VFSVVNVATPHFPAPIHVDGAPSQPSRTTFFKEFLTEILVSTAGAGRERVTQRTRFSRAKGKRPVLTPVALASILRLSDQGEPPREFLSSIHRRQEGLAYQICEMPSLSFMDL